MGGAGWPSGAEVEGGRVMGGLQWSGCPGGRVTGGLHRVDSKEHPRPVPGQGTQCAEGLRLEVPGRRGGRGGGGGEKAGISFQI